MSIPSAFAASLSPGERAAYGRSARGRVSRSGHGRYEGGDRTDPIEVIERQSAQRVPELVPIRYARMLESPFRFYRGAAAIMAMDLGRMPHTDLTVQLCGDAHLLNFRLLASPSVIWSSTSTTSTRRSPARSSGTSSGWRPAS